MLIMASPVWVLFCLFTFGVVHLERLEVRNRKFPLGKMQAGQTISLIITRLKPVEYLLLRTSL